MLAQGAACPGRDDDRRPVRAPLLEPAGQHAGIGDRLRLVEKEQPSRCDEGGGERDRATLRGPQPAECLVGELPGAEPVSEATQELVDAEVRRIVDEEQAATEALLAQNRERLDSLAEALLERETLDETDAYAAAGIERQHVAVPQ